jgi:hypothetical protein
MASGLTFEQRRRAIRHERSTDRVSSATSLAAWIVGLGALTIVAGGGLLGFR